MSFEVSPDYVALAWCLAFAIAFFAGAMVLTMRHRARSERPGCAVWLMLAATVYALLAAWEAYSPTPWY